MKKKQIKLEVPSEDAQYFAISTTLSIHKLAWELNSNLHLKLSQVAPIDFKEACFPCLKDEEGLPQNNILIVKNKLEASILVKELANVDFILKIQGAVGTNEVKDFISRLKKIQSIAAIIGIDPKKIKGLGIFQHL
jgi:hypothetical protein